MRREPTRKLAPKRPHGPHAPGPKSTPQPAYVGPRVVTGLTAIESMLGRASSHVAALYADAANANKLRALAARYELAQRVEVRQTSELEHIAQTTNTKGRSIDALAICGEYTHVALEHFADPKTFSLPLLVVLDEVSDPHNVGAIIRSSAAFGAAGVITMERRACPITHTVVRAAAGATEMLPIAQVSNLRQALEQLKTQGWWIAGMAMDAPHTLGVDQILDRTPTVLVVGSEGEGLRRLTRETCDLLFKIPMHGALDSLNVSVATGIALYALSRSFAR